MTSFLPPSLKEIFFWYFVQVLIPYHLFSFASQKQRANALQRLDSWQLAAGVPFILHHHNTSRQPVFLLNSHIAKNEPRVARPGLDLEASPTLFDRIHKTVTL